MTLSVVMNGYSLRKSRFGERESNIGEMGSQDGSLYLDWDSPAGQVSKEGTKART